MPPRRTPNRPQTLKEARRAYLKRGGSSYVSNEERQRLIRAQEREEKRVEKVKKEAARQEAAKKRADTLAKQRDERRRLGIPDPSVKISPGQMRIGAFLKGKELEESEVVDDTENDAEKQEDVDREQGVNDLRVLSPRIEEAVEDPQIQDEDFGSDIEDQDALAIGITATEVPQPLATQAKPALLAADLRSSFFESNSQIEREVNNTVATSPIEKPLVEEAPREQNFEPALTPRAVSTKHVPPAKGIKTPEQSEIESILFGISSQELDFLPSSPPSKVP